MSTRRISRLGIGTPLALVALAVAVATPAASLAAAKTKRASVNSAGAQSSGFSSGTPAIAANGRYVVFESDADDLVAGDSNDTDDIYVHDRTTGKTKRVSVRSNGTEGDRESESPAISVSGRYVAFESDARLVKGDTNDEQDIFVHDRATGTTRRVSIRSNGAEGNDQSGAPAVSADGRFVAFHSSATNLVNGDTNGVRDVFVHDRNTGQLKRVSLSPTGAQAIGGESDNAAISASGRYVAFESDATNLVNVDTNGFTDVFVKDRNTGATKRVSLGSHGVQGNGNSGSPAVSADGRYIAFASEAPNLVDGDTNGVSDVFVRDRNTGKTRRMSVRSNGAQGDGSSGDSAISPEGRYVAFSSEATNLVKGDTNGFRDVFVHDRTTGKTRRVSVRTNLAEANDGSGSPAISIDGLYVAFGSTATNLVNADTNAERDTFWRGPL